MTNLTTVLQALSDGTRRQILNALRDKDCTPTELLVGVSMTKPSLSHHLTVLKQANLVIVERKGKNLLYSLNVSVFEEVMAHILNFFTKEDK